MKVIDLKDRKILYELDCNARQSLSVIGKKTGLTKSSVAYRIKRLENQGIIKSYFTFIDGIRLGYIVLRLYTSFQYTTKEIEDEIIKYFTQNKTAMGIYSLNGRYDFEAVFWIKNINKFYSFWQNILDKYGDYFQDQILSFYIRYISYKYSYLLPDEADIASDRLSDVLGSDSQTSISDTDFNILKIISSNARIPLTEIAQQLKMHSDTVNYHLNRLIKLKIIQGYRANIDIAKIGYQYFKIDIYLKDYHQRRKIINYVVTNPHLVSINETTGISHLELELHLKSITDLHNFMNDINIKFPNALRNYKYFIFQKTHKYLFLPEE
jgi:Lrp/AsnC family transcriptional regulator for asnA, asnC and gidA